ncbi:MAG: DUF1570 domain-containing protein, partial [Planctomycetota bacterium]|nr:DUF1570 domain-containing protein [Planctomycetota bacterium]
FRRATADTTLAKPDGRALPAKPTTAESGLLVKIRAAMDEGRPARAVRLARAQPRRSALVEMLLARALEEEGEAAEALAVIKRVRAADPAYVPAEEARARLLRRLGREDEAFEAYRDIAERYPGGAELQARAASFFVGLGRRDEARELLATALANGLRSRALDAANRTLIRALNGPPWAKRHTYTSRHYLVVSNIDRTTAEKAARLLERAYAKYQSTLDRVDDKNRRRFRVFLFRGQRGFLEFSERTWGRTHSRHTAGFYNLGLKDLFIWNLPQREKMFGTILHEGFHQYLDRIMEGVPLWFNEGLAEYYSVAEKSGADKVALLRRVGTSPLSAWLRLDNAAFMAGAQKNYLQAWALLAFLRTTTPEREALFRKFWRAFRKHPTRRAGLAAALEGVDVAALDREFRAWLRTG